jgi:hypothetical protein
MSGKKKDCAIDRSIDRLIRSPPQRAPCIKTEQEKQTKEQRAATKNNNGYIFDRFFPFCWLLSLVVVLVLFDRCCNSIKTHLIGRLSSHPQPVSAAAVANAFSPSFLYGHNYKML